MAIDGLYGLGELAEGLGTAGEVAGGAAAATGAAAAGGAFSGGATAPAATTPTAAPTTQSGGSFLGNAGKSAILGSVTSFGLNKAFGANGRGVNIPPPPGAAMIDPEGAQAAAMLRQRQAASGGLNSTVTPAGQGPSGNTGYDSATGGGKALLGS